jgi:hypothetical protein
MNNLSFLFSKLKGGPGSGNRGHAGRPGKRGGSVSKHAAAALGYGYTTNKIKITDHPTLADGVYTSSSYYTSDQKTTAENKAKKLGHNYTAVRVGDFYHVVSTTESVKKPAKSEVEKLYDNQTPERQVFAQKYGLLPTDSTSEQYLNEIKHKLPIVNTSKKIDTDSMQYQAVHRVSLQNSDDKNKLEESMKYGYAFNKDTGEYGKISPKTHKILGVNDSTALTGKRYFIVEKDFKKPTKAELKKEPTFEPDFNKMSALTTLGSDKLAEINSSMKETWNNADHFRFKAEAKNAFKITPPDHVTKEYNEVKASINTEKFSMYHGTHHEAASHISRDGYRINPKPKIGRVWGNGLYLADGHSKAVQYAHEGSGSAATYSRGVMFYNKASLGSVESGKVSVPFGTTRPSASSAFPGKVERSNNLREGLDTLIVKPSGRWTSNEFVVKNSRGVVPTVWVDIEREPTYR